MMRNNFLAWPVQGYGIDAFGFELVRRLRVRSRGADANARATLAR